MYEKKNEYDITLEAHKSILSKLEGLSEKIKTKRFFLGFDGYIDSLYSLAKTRESLSEWERMDQMSIFGQRILDVAGSSANVERVLKRKISGGFAPNTCKAVNGLGIEVCLMASIGFPEVDQLFSSLAERQNIKALPIGNPGETLGLEFDDGKIMLTDFENIYKITWNSILERIGQEALFRELEHADAMGFGHWSLLLAMDDIWTHLIEEIFPSLSNIDQKLFFVDLADIKKRKKKDIQTMLKILAKANEQVPVMLSLNDQEAIDISKALDDVPTIEPNKENYGDYIDAGKKLNQKIGISYLVIHSPHFATISTPSEHYWVTEGFTSKPSYTTGAGDHFHSGVAVGISCDLEPQEAILIGNALTAIFVRTGDSPDFMMLSKFIQRYMEYIETDNPKFP